MNLHRPGPQWVQFRNAHVRIEAQHSSVGGLCSLLRIFHWQSDSRRSWRPLEGAYCSSVLDNPWLDAFSVI